MIGNYFKILLRSLIKRRVYTIINVLGLAIGITSFILIMLYVMDEVSYDRHHRKADDIYRVCMVYDFEGVGENSASMPFPVAFTLKDEYPDMIEQVVRVFNFQSNRNLVEYEELKFNESRIFFADSTFFEIFDHEFIAGDPATALDEPTSVVITESMARKYFGEEEPMGKTLQFEAQMPLKVTGIIRDVQPQTHFRFDFIASLNTLNKAFGGRLPQTWVWNPCWTYIVLAKDVDPEDLEANFPAFIGKYYYDAQRESITMYLQHLPDIHLHSRLDYELEPNGNYSYIVTLSVIAVFLLVIASINFMNLSTATAGSRLREIGIRKVTGADRTRLFIQFIGESLFMTLLALLLSLILIELLLPIFNTYTGKEIFFDDLLTPQYILDLFLLWLLLGLLSGAYPAIYLSSFKPIAILKGNMGSESRSGLARKVLVVFQFTISIALIIGTVVIFRQVKFLRSAELGFNPKNIVMLPIHRTAIASDFQTFKDEILKNPDILSVTTVDDILGAAHNTHEFRHKGMTDEEWRFYPALVVGDDFLKTFEIEIIAGRDYYPKNQVDPVNGILVNEAMVKHLGWNSNEEALGEKFRSLNGEERIIGVFRDFQATSLREPSGPFVLNMKEIPGHILFFMRYAAIRVSGNNKLETLDFMEKTWANFEQNRPFDYKILETELKNLYKEESNLGTLSLVFTVLILFVAALGLFGLASFMAEKRTKEIGIRKVLGASIINILVLLQRDFAKLILIAMVIAWPLAYLLIEELFLQQFALRVPFNAWIFILSGAMALAISMLIISWKALAASMVNPVDTLKYE
jgi:putative ABC transport system permease protein